MSGGDASLGPRGQGISHLNLAPPPRAVKRKGARDAGFWYFWLFIVPLTLFGLWLVAKLGMNIAVMRHGTIVTATVDGTSTYTSRSTTHYTAEYHYELNGKTYKDSDPVDYEQYLNLEKGDPLQVRAGVFGGYAVSMIASRAGHEVGSLAFATVLINWMMGLFVVALWVAPRRRRRLLIWGDAAQGVITDRRRTGQKKPTNYIHYQFTPAGAHEPISGKQMVSRPDYDAAQVQQAITVFYDPQRPTRSIAYDFCDWQLEGWRS
jgi:hypothetical protein